MAKIMIKFVYEIDSNQRYVFRYNPNLSKAYVTNPGGTTSEADRVQDVYMFRDWVDAILGSILPPNTLTLFQYVFNKAINKGSEDFIIQASYLVSICMSDAERNTFKADAIRLDNEYFAKTGQRISLDAVQLIYASRHRMDAHLLLEQFNELLNH